MKEINYIQNYLYEHIPLSKAMEVRVLEATGEKVILSAPLMPNINHRETVFGGSASALAILAAWTLVHFRLRNENLNCRVVIQKNTMSYDKPILDEFKAICTMPEREHWDKFTKILKRKNRSRIVVESKLECSGEIVGRFEGAFVAMDIRHS